MKRYFSQDTVGTALVAGLGSMAAFCLLLWLGLALAGEPVMAHIRWFGGMFVPLILVLRAYAKTGRHLTATRTLIVLLFAGFVAFMAYLLGTHQLVFK